MKIEPIRRIARPTPAEFRSEIEPAQRPVVIEGALRDWRALERWDAEYLKAQVGDESVSCMAAPENEPDGTFSLGRWSETGGRVQLEKRLSDFVDEVWTTERPRVYLRSSSPKILERLEGDLAPLDYVDRRAGVMRTLWMGATGSLAPPHFDNANNLHAMVRGRKRFLLFDKVDSRRMYANGLFSGYYPHMSRIRDIESAEAERFPRTRDLRAHECVLEPGDLLFLPMCWWHQVHTLEPSIAIATWWRGHLHPLHRLALRRRAFTAYQRLRSAIGATVAQGG